MKHCKCCNQTKPLEEFYKKKYSPNSPWIPSTLCKKCTAKENYKRAQTPPTKQPHPERSCIKCLTIKPIEDFAMCGKRMRYTCKECHLAEDRVREAKLRAKDPSRSKQSTRAVLKHYRKAREIVFDHYGWKCECCGETIPQFLTIDHIDGGGCQHRKQVGNQFYPWLKRAGFPEGYRTLCLNCNAGRQRNGGICPHKTILQKLVVPPVA